MFVLGRRGTGPLPVARADAAALAETGAQPPVAPAPARDNPLYSPTCRATAQGRSRPQVGSPA